MNIHFSLKLDMNSREKRLLRRGAVAAALAAVFGVGLALAKPIDTTWIQSNEPISATKLKGNLEDLQAAADALQTKVNALQATVDALGKQVTELSTIRVERLKFGGPKEDVDGGCKPGACAVYRKTDGVTSVDWRADGTYEITFGQGVFSEVPSCTCNSHQPGKFGGGICGGVSGLLVANPRSFFVATSDRDGIPTDSQVDVVCVGKR